MQQLLGFSVRMSTDHGTDAREEIVRGVAYFVGSTMTVKPDLPLLKIFSFSNAHLLMTLLFVSLGFFPFLFLFLLLHSTFSSLFLPCSCLLSLLSPLTLTLSLLPSPHHLLFSLRSSTPAPSILGHRLTRKSASGMASRSFPHF